MKKLDIAITKASIVSFDVAVEEGKPKVGVTLALMTEGGKIVTTYSAGTESWRSDPIELPVNALPLIGDLARMLEGIAVRKCRDYQKALPAPVKSADQPIDLSEIPF